MLVSSIGGAALAQCETAEQALQEEAGSDGCDVWTQAYLDSVNGIFRSSNEIPTAYGYMIAARDAFHLYEVSLSVFDEETLAQLTLPIVTLLRLSLFVASRDPNIEEERLSRYLAALFEIEGLVGFGQEAPWRELLVHLDPKLRRPEFAFGAMTFLLCQFLLLKVHSL
ncbi:MAG: hypothetical protein JKX69_11525 [Rhodobacteraceae bacterium]|nr:hypothetical protein [Paracoccaceae bacterium]